MKRCLASLVALGLCLGVPTAAQAQNWSPVEKEVLQAIETCLETVRSKNLEGFMACHHDDFLGWDNGMPGPRDKSFARGSTSLNFAAGDLVAWSIQPLGIRVHGNVAIVHYYGYYAEREKGGKETRTRYRWTDIMLKQGNKWVWIADHGGADPGNKPSGSQ